jgi:hypothetical protein
VRCQAPRSAARLDRLAGDDQLLDQPGPFVDPEQPHVTIEPLDPVIGDIAGAAQDLDGAVGDPPDRLARDIFGGSRLEGDWLSCGLSASRPRASARAPPYAELIRAYLARQALMAYEAEQRSAIASSR